VAAGLHQPERAAELYGAAQARLMTAPDRTPPLDRVEFERHLQLAREQLGEERFHAMHIEGCAMSMEQAIDVALAQMC